MNLTRRTRHAAVAIGTAGALVVLGGGLAVASYSGVSSKGQILACWNSAGVRIVDHYPCRTGETPLSWNQKGVKGDTGPTGAAGASGTDGSGLMGATGATGAAGATGATGATGPAGVAGPSGAPGADGADGADGLRGAQGIQGEVGPAGAAAVTRSSGPLYAYLSGCSMYGNASDVAPTKGGQPAATVGTVTMTAPGVYHLEGLTPGRSYGVYVCSIGNVTQTATADGTLDVVLRGYDQATATYGAGFDANGAPLQVNWTENNVSKYASTLVLTAP